MSLPAGTVTTIAEAAHVALAGGAQITPFSRHYPELDRADASAHVAITDIGHEADAKTVQRRGEIGDRHVGAFDGQLMPLVEISVRACAGYRAGCRGGERFQHGAPCDWHRLI